MFCNIMLIYTILVVWQAPELHVLKNRIIL